MIFQRATEAEEDTEAVGIRAVIIDTVDVGKTNTVEVVPEAVKIGGVETAEAGPAAAQMEEANTSTGEVNPTEACPAAVAEAAEVIPKEAASTTVMEETKPTQAGTTAVTEETKPTQTASTAVTEEVNLKEASSAADAEEAVANGEEQPPTKALFPSKKKNLRIIIIKVKIF